MSSSDAPQRSADLVIVANRLPVDQVVNPDGSSSWRRSPGGLVTALEPVMRANDGAWIGWPGSADDDDFERGAAAGFLGLGLWRIGELDAAYGHWGDAMTSLWKAGHVVDAIGCLRPRAQIRLAQGRLRDAMRAYERGLRMASEPGAPALRGAGDMHVGLAEVLLERNDLEGAEQQIIAAFEQHRTMVGS